MKLSTSLFLLASAVSTDAAPMVRSAQRALLDKSRLLEDAEWNYLGNYSIKMITCLSGEAYTNPENGETEANSVVYRLCPVDSCSDSSDIGCKAGYGDYLVGLNTYVQEWLQDKAENMQVDDNNNWKANELGECREYRGDKNGNNNGNQYYVGPACGEDNTVILGFFSDEYCTTVPDDVTFEDISNGWSLPFTNSPLITTACETCSGTDENGNYEIYQMCENLYTDAALKCEAEMTYFNEANGQQTGGWESIQAFLPKAAKSGNAGAAVGWTIFALVIVGAGAYAYYTWWIKKKSASGMTVDGM